MPGSLASTRSMRGASIANGHLPRVLSVPDVHSATIVNRDPGCPASGIQKRGQSAMASEPSSIFSISRKGDTTLIVGGRRICKSGLLFFLDVWAPTSVLMAVGSATLAFVEDITS